LRTREIAEITEKSLPYVGSYLRNMRKYGLVDKNGFLWFLTPIGKDLLEYFESFEAYKRMLYKIKKVRGKGEKDKKRKRESSSQKACKQVSVRLWLKDSGLGETEKEVVELLADHYNRTGSKFILVKGPYELADRLNVNPERLLEALKNLRQENIIYIFRSQLGHEAGRYWKVGLKKAFIQILEVNS